MQSVSTINLVLVLVVPLSGMLVALVQRVVLSIVHIQVVSVKTLNRMQLESDAKVRYTFLSNEWESTQLL